MVAAESLKDLVHQPDLTTTDKLLLCLAVNVDEPKRVKEIRDLASQVGLTKFKKINISAYLARSRGHAIRVHEGWVLTPSGKSYVADLADPLLKLPVAKTAPALRGYLSQIQDLQTRAFVDEAIRCFEVKCYRAAVVLSWVGAVSVLHEYVLKHHLSAFNTEASKRNPKWKPAKTRDDLGNMKEVEFLNILVAISVIGKNVKQELEARLKLRNGCGHPSSLQVAEHQAAAHIEALILNLFSQFTP